MPITGRKRTKLSRAASDMAQPPDERERTRPPARTARRGAGCPSAGARARRPSAARAARDRSACRRAGAGRRGSGRRARRSRQRPAEQALVHLVDEVLAEEQPVEPARRGATRAARRVVAEVPHRQHEAGERDRDRDPEERHLGSCAPRAGSGSGSIGSRKCGTSKKPPIADSTASTTSTPVIDSGDSWT